MTNNFLIENFKHLTSTPQNVEQLKKLVLQLAVQGKLTAKWREENPDVEPASVLLEKIKAENEEIKKAYNLRNHKPLLKISDNEIPFEIPENWNWQRLGNAFYTTSGGTPSRGNTDFWNGTIPWLKSGELTDGLIIKEPEEKITELGHKNSSTYLFPEETLLIALYGATAGRLGILKFSSTTNQAICGFFTNKFICTEYLFYYLWAFRSKILSDSWGQAQPNISQDYLKKFCFALPPLSEQQAIVSIIKNLFLEIDQLHALAQKKISLRENAAKALFGKINKPINSEDIQQTWQQLIANFKTLTQSKESVKQLRQTILQLAVQGKLTAKWREENPDVEPASVLLEKIKAEKEQLIKEGEIKKGAKQPPAKKQEISIPNSWLLVDLDDITKYITDGTHQTPRYVDSGKMFLSAQNVKPFRFMPDNHKFVTEEAFLDYIKNRKPEKGDILVGRVGSKGEAAVIDRDLEFAIYVSLGLIKTFQDFTPPEYIAIVMNSPYGVDYATGNMSSLGSSAGNFNLGRIRSFPIPFPPFDEQNEIVSMVNQLMNLCDELEKKISERDSYQERIMQAVVKQAFTTKLETVETE